MKIEMKKSIYIKTILQVFILGLISFSCNDILEQESLIYLENTNPIKDARSAEAAVNGMYDALQSGRLYGSDFILANELTAGNAKAAGFSVQWTELETGIIPTANFHVEDNWVNFYQAINTANTILASVPDLAGVSAGDKDYFMGQAYFVRALAYFDLLRQYGEFDTPDSRFGIPISIEPILSPTSIARNSVSDSYDRIFSDLAEAESLLDYSGNKAFASKAAVEALLARVYLYNAQYASALEYAEKVIDNSSYSFLDNYNNLYMTKGNDESILELEFTEQDQNNFNITLLTSPPEVAVSQELFDEFSTADERRALFSEESDGTIRCLKYGTSPNLAASNVIIIRLAEMYLIRAEALARNNEFDSAIDDINVLRDRAGAQLLSADNYSSTDEVLDAILAEKRLEFAFENGNYWFDISRLGKLPEMRNLDNFRRIYPIPNREMLADDALVQNPGYEQ